jgi:hypothetical protein
LSSCNALLKPNPGLNGPLVKTSGGIVRFGTVVIQENSFEAAITQEGAAEFSDPLEWLVHSFAIHLDSRRFRILGRPVGRFNAKLPSIRRVQPLPAELHRLTANDAADGSSAEKVIQNVETNVPTSSTH